MKKRSTQTTSNSLEHSIMKKRRGRQPRTSLLNANLEQAVTTFASQIGGPIVQPGKFRDFSGWLNTINGSEYSSAWNSLCNSFSNEKNSVSSDQIDQLKIDIVHEIINRVVKQQPHESPKLVKTNARRQSKSNPQSGHTLMSIFESRLIHTEGSGSGQREHFRATESKTGESSSAGRHEVGSSKSRGASTSQALNSRSPTHRVHGGSSTMEIASLLNLNDDVHPMPSSRRGSTLPPMSDFLDDVSAKNRHRDTS